MDIRSNGDTGKLLFEWNPERNIIDIVKSGMLYKIRLSNNSSQPYKILEKKPYNSNERKKHQRKI
ncbi:hypothetical protein [[Ruminococcus] torques]|uniref:hypothetical protein n=1 Tax=[Ruminococcus] torques TaxID=33039 RepID=UPI00242DF935|nr:hypothetical protein [[Ruminococcus] torques]